MSEGPSSKAAPLLKWAGGKRQLTRRILACLPDRIDTYFEPFVGGGAIFFALAQEGRFRHAVLSDQNRELIETYQAVRDNVEGVIAALRQMRHSEEDYYRIRSLSPRKAVRRAARMIYLNRTGYNGLYRVNRAGQFNVPFGRYVRPKICDEPRLKAAAAALQGVELKVTDFQEAVTEARPGDAVYFDPPYVPVSQTARFAEYHHLPFDQDEHERLCRVYAELVGRRVAAVLSNSDVRMTRQLYREFQVESVGARRNINSRVTSRGPVSELLVIGPSAHRSKATSSRKRSKLADNPGGVV